MTENTQTRPHRWLRPALVVSAVVVVAGIAGGSAALAAQPTPADGSVAATSAPTPGADGAGPTPGAEATAPAPGDEATAPAPGEGTRPTPPTEGAGPGAGECADRPAPRRAAVLRWFSWRRNGFRTAPGAVLLRTGAVWRTLVVVPLPRVQSVAFDQGPLLRRLRLARVRVHTVQGPITADIGAIDQDDAHGFFEDVSRLAVEAARADRTHRWLERASGREEERR